MSIRSFFSKRVWACAPAFMLAAVASTPALAVAAVGDPVGPVIEVAQLPGGSSIFYGPPAVGMDRRGNFVVVWLRQSRENDRYSSVILGQRFAADGSRIGPEFSVGPAPLLYPGPNDPGYVRLSMNADGAFAVVWVTSWSPGSVHVRAFNAQAEPVTPDIPILLSKSAYQQEAPDVAMAPDGRFAVAWGDEIPDRLIGLTVLLQMPVVYRVNVQRFDAHGGRQGFPIRLDRFANRPELLTRAYQSGYVGDPRLAFDSEGRLSVVWNTSLGSPRDVFSTLQTFDATGRAEAPPERIGAPAGVFIDTPVIGVDRHGRRLIAVQANDGAPIGLQRFDRYGTPEQPLLTPFGEPYDRQPEIAVRPEGDFVMSLRRGLPGHAAVQFFDMQGLPVGNAGFLGLTPGEPARTAGCSPAASAAATAVVACSLYGASAPSGVGVYVQRYAVQ